MTNPKPDTPPQIETFHVHIRVHRGDYLALDSSALSVVSCSSGSAEQLLFAPALAVNAPFSAAGASDNCTMLLQATIG